MNFLARRGRRRTLNRRTAARRVAEALPSTTLRGGRLPITTLCLAHARRTVAIHRGLIALRTRRLARRRTKAPPTAIVALSDIAAAVSLRRRRLRRTSASELASLRRVGLLMREEPGVIVAARDRRG